MQKTLTSVLLGAGAGLVAAAPAPWFVSERSHYDNRSTAADAAISIAAASAACTFTDAAKAVAGKASCSSIVLNGIAVPAGKTLDMTDLADGTTVSFPCLLIDDRVLTRGRSLSKEPLHSDILNGKDPWLAFLVPESPSMVLQGTFSMGMEPNGGTGREQTVARPSRSSLPPTSSLIPPSLGSTS